MCVCVRERERERERGGGGSVRGVIMKVAMTHQNEAVQHIGGLPLLLVLVSYGIAVGAGKHGVGPAKLRHSREQVLQGVSV